MSTPQTLTQDATKLETKSCGSTDKATVPQNGSICHVEFTVPNIEQSAKVYGQLFGWNFMPFQSDSWYFTTPNNYGPCGCMNQGKAALESQTMIYVNCDNLNGMIAKAGELGAKTITPRTEIPGGHGWFATIKMPEGNTWGLYSKN